MGLESAQVKIMNVGPLSSAATATAAFVCPNDLTIKSVKIVSIAGLAASDSNYLITTVTNLGAAGSGSTVIAEHDTRAAHEDALVAKIPESANLNATATNLRCAAGDVIKVLGTTAGTLTADYNVTIGYCTR